MVRENLNVTLKCVAKGYPKPTIRWRREDGKPIEFADWQEKKIRKIDPRKPPADMRGVSLSHPLANVRAHFLTAHPHTHTHARSRCRGGGNTSHKQSQSFAYGSLSGHWFVTHFFPVCCRLLFFVSFFILHLLFLFPSPATNGVPPSVSRRILLNVHCECRIKSLFAQGLICLLSFWHENSPAHDMGA